MRDELTLPGPSARTNGPLDDWTHVLHDVTDVLASSRGLLEAAPRALLAIGEGLDCSRVSLWTRDPDRPDAPYQCARAWGRDAASAAFAAGDEGAAAEQAMLRRAAASRTPVAESDRRAALDEASSRPPPRPGPDAAPPSARSGLLSIPIVYGDLVYGGLVLSKTSAPAGRDGDLVAAATLGKQIGQFVARESALRDLLRSRRELADLFEHAPVGLHLMDPAGRILRVNRTELEMLGYAREELVGKLWRDLHVDRSEADSLLARLAGVASAPGESQIHHAEARLRCKSGAIKWVRVDANVLRDEGEFVHVRTFVRDVTASKEAEASLRASEERYRRLIEGTREYGLHALDAEGRVTGWSEGAQRLYGYAEKDVVGRDFARSFSPADRAEGVPSRVVRLAADEGELRHEGLRVRKDGSTFWAEVVYTALRDPDGRLVGISQLTRDVSERRRVESLRRQRADLDAANREVLESSRRGAQLLRSAIAAMSGPAERIAAAASRLARVRETDAGAASDVASLSAGVAGLSRAISELNEATTAAPASPGSDPAPIELLRLAVESKDLLREAAAERRVRVDVDVDSAITDVVADPLRLRQVFYNLLTNAVESTRERGRVALRVVAEGPTRFRLEVEDSGIGIAERDLPRAFDLVDEDRAASAADEHAPEPEGVEAATAPMRPTARSLGLAATRRIVEDQGGRVAAESTLGRGSVFAAVLPRVPPSRRADAAATAATAQPSDAEDAPRAVVVSEDPATRAAVSWTLGHVGVEAVAAPQGEQGLDFVRRRAFDAVAVDFLLGTALGGMNAIDFVATLRGEGHSRDLSTVLVAVGTGAAGASCLAVADLLPRPAPADRLLAALDRAGVLRARRRPVVVVDRDLAVLETTTITLRAIGVTAIAEPAGDAALRACAEQTPSAVLLASSIHGMDPFEFLRQVRLMKSMAAVPVILLLPRSLADAEVESLRAAAASSTDDVAWARSVSAAAQRRRERPS